MCRRNYHSQGFRSICIGSQTGENMLMNLNLLSKRVGAIPKWGRQADSRAQLCFFRNTTASSIRCFSESNQRSFTVSYLVNSCGMSPETAISASKKVRIESPKNPDSVLAFLRNCGCTDADVTKIVTKVPSLLLVSPEKALFPKLQIFRSMGFSSADLANILSSQPIFLKRRFEKVLISQHNVLKSVDICNEGAVKFLKRTSWFSSKETMTANIAVLRETGVPISNIAYLVVRYHSIGQRSDKFSANVKKVLEMGFDPSKYSFVNALQVFCQMTESTWGQKLEIYRRWGWSEDETLMAFRTRPQCLQLSEKKINKVMDFLVNKMGWEPAHIARASVAVCLKFEERVVPRCLVVKALLLKGLVKKDLKLSHFLCHNEEDFLGKYVTKYLDRIPQLSDIYHGKVSFMELQHKS